MVGAVREPPLLIRVEGDVVSIMPVMRPTAQVIFLPAAIVPKPTRSGKPRQIHNPGPIIQEKFGCEIKQGMLY